MKKITLWRPSTCGCVVLLAWDTDDPEATRVHTPVAEAFRDGVKSAEVSTCPIHAAHKGNLVSHHAAVVKENVGMGKAIHAVAAALKIEPPEVQWEFDSNRALVIKHNVPGAHHKAIRDAAGIDVVL